MFRIYKFYITNDNKYNNGSNLTFGRIIDVRKFSRLEPRISLNPRLFRAIFSVVKKYLFCLLHR